MNSPRRRIAGALAAALLFGASLPAAAEPIEVTASAVEAFEPNAPQTERFGRLRFLGGLQLDSPDERFGGISGIEVSADGGFVLMATDTGNLMRGALVERDGRPAGLADVEIWRLGDEDGKALGGKWGSDAESLRAAPGHRLDRVLVGFERDNRVIVYDVSGDGEPRYVRQLAVPDGVRDLPHNLGLEAIAVAPEGTPDAGRTVMFGESPGEDGRIPGWLLDADGAAAGELWLAASDDFSATDAAFTDTGDLIVLERRYKPLFGVAMRLRRIAAADIRPGAVLEGEELVTARMDRVVDNMEGLAFHRDADGRAILTIVSDDNFNVLQRNLLLRFELVE